MIRALLLLALLLPAPAARAEVLWRGDFAGDWMARWNVVRIGKLGALMETRDDPRWGRFMRVVFPPGDVREGFAFQAELLPLIGHRERLWLSYRVRFSPGFEWARGGKLPGLMTRRHGRVSGCDRPDGTGGFSTRYSWTPGGGLALYPYVPVQPGFASTPRGCASHHPLGGRIESGRWTHLVQEVRLNSPGRDDGAIRAWIDGRPALALDGVRFRDVPFGIEGILFATFYGGRCCAPERPGNFIDFAAFSVHDAPPPGIAPVP